jgi:undecaprenyl diphosphate synthase
MNNLHVAIIMDGNGRWARARNRPRTAGHLAGARSVRQVIEAAPGLEIGTLTLYAFSSDNWSRPAHEVRTLMSLFREHLIREKDRMIEQGVRLSVIGRRDRLAQDLVTLIERVEDATAGGRTLHLRIAVDYSARWAIVEAARRTAAEPHIPLAEFSRRINLAMNSRGTAPDVDLMIRTSGEQRLSDFLLWESAYAEFVFTELAWPEFGARELARAVEEFRKRDRRFGSIASSA